MQKFNFGQGAKIFYNMIMVANLKKGLEDLLIEKDRFSSEEVLKIQFWISQLSEFEAENLLQSKKTEETNKNGAGWKKAERTALLMKMGKDFFDMIWFIVKFFGGGP
ncbi:MAG: hypothetical protein H6581_07245 [Bacteroidia bacterium]|nr:hypothetical protein [Bacteroidia bacterium]